MPGVEQWSTVYPNCAGDTQSPVALPGVPQGVETRASDLGSRLRVVRAHTYPISVKPQHPPPAPIQGWDEPKPDSETF